jgi:TonB family protein
MLRAISCATTVFIATAFVHAQDVRSTVGPLEQSATVPSPENPIPRRLSAPPAAGVDWQGATGRGLLRLQVTLDATGSIAEIRTVTEPLVQFAAGTTIGDNVRRAIAAAILESAAAALSQWKYDLPPAPITFPVQFLFASAADPVATQNPPPPVPVPPSSALPPPQIEDWPAASGIPRANRVSQPPKQINKVPPVYPLAAQLERVRGVVIMEAIVGADGKVRDVRVIRSVPFLDEAAVAAVMQWEYTPAEINGQPTPVVMTITTTFNMDVGVLEGPLTVPQWPAAEGVAASGAASHLRAGRRTPGPIFLTRHSGDALVAPFCSKC